LNAALVLGSRFVHNASTHRFSGTMTRSSQAVETTTAPDSGRAIASWYTESTSDGVGDRLLMFDNIGTPSLELLRFRPGLAYAGSFERALRDRVAQLASFAHPSFPQIRAVQHLDDGALALVSTTTTGKRLGEIFRSPQAQGGAHPAFAAWLVRDLTAALTDLQQFAPGIAHGALSPERIVITPDGRLVITEHVLAAALDTLRLSVNELWRELGLIATTTAGPTSRLDCRTDVVQLGWIVLSVLLGRRLAPIDHAGRVELLLDEFARRSAMRSPALVPPLRRWLERALQIDDQPFESAADAQTALYQLRLHGGPHGIVAGGKQAMEHLAFGPPVQLSSVPRIGHPSDDSEEPVEPAESTRGTADEDLALGTATAPQQRGSDDSAGSASNDRLNGIAWLAWAAAAIFAAVAVGEGFVIWRMSTASRAPVAFAGVPVTLESLVPGDTVAVDGRDVGVTPLSVTLTPTTRSITVRSQAVQPAALPPLPIVDHPVDATAATLAQARSQRGGVRLASPIELQVFEGERVLGSTADGPIVTTAGRHELDFVNTTVGFRSRQIVDIRAGQIVRLAVTPPDGRVSINAVPWASVSIDGTAAGDTPLANLPLSVGEHQITFRHPQLGEQTQKVLVKAGGLTRVSAAFSR
jgi:PEGA domain-containing protein